MTNEANSAKTNDRQAELKLMTVTELKELALEVGIDSTTGLRKSELIDEILKVQSRQAQRDAEDAADFMDVQEAGPYWLAIAWQVSEKLAKRAMASLGKDWHSAKKTLRLFRVHWDDAGPHAREHYEDFLLPDEAKNWFVNIDEATTGWKLELGYLTPEGKFFSLLHSADIHMGSSQRHQFSAANASKPQLDLISQLTNREQLSLSIEGDISLSGATNPGAKTSVDDESVNVHNKTGTFSWKAPLQNGRVVVPIVSEMGNQRLRAVISIESNIHYLEPEKLGIDS